MKPDKVTCLVTWHCTTFYTVYVDIIQLLYIYTVQQYNFVNLQYLYSVERTTNSIATITKTSTYTYSYYAIQQESKELDQQHWLPWSGAVDHLIITIYKTPPDQQQQHNIILRHHTHRRRKVFIIGTIPTIHPINPVVITSLDLGLIHPE